MDCSSRSFLFGASATHWWQESVHYSTKLSTSRMKKCLFRTSFSWCADGWSSFKWSAVTSPGATDRGTTMASVVPLNGCVTRTTSRPSLAIVHTCRYRLTSLTLVSFFEGRVPWCRWAFTRLRSAHSDCVESQALREVYGIDTLPDENTAECSCSLFQTHTVHLGSRHGSAFLLAKSASGLLEPLRWLTVH